MAIGKGKYDDLTTIVRERSGARGAIVIVIGGAHGNGFSMQAPPALTLQLPAILRTIADQIERDIYG
jgi:hypothetical protein